MMARLYAVYSKVTQGKGFKILFDSYMISFTGLAIQESKADQKTCLTLACLLELWKGYEQELPPSGSV